MYMPLFYFDKFLVTFCAVFLAIKGVSSFYYGSFLMNCMDSSLVSFLLLCVPGNMQFIIFEVTSEYVKKYCSLLIVCYLICQLLLFLPTIGTIQLECCLICMVLQHPCPGTSLFISR